MERRGFIKSLGLGLAAVRGFPGIVSAQENAVKPNIILIVADDLGYGDLGCYGNMLISTPRIDQLAREGMRFTDFHSNCPVCSPTRAALLTGRYQQRCGIEGVVSAVGHYNIGMELKEVTFAEVLKASGYATGIFGKWHLGYQVDFNPARQGFDEFRGYLSGNIDYRSHIDQAGREDWWKNLGLLQENGYTTDLITNHGMDFIERHRGMPFCLYVAHESPHYPYQGRYDPPDRKPGNANPILGSRKDREIAYREMVQILDEGIGRTVDLVDKLGLAANTFIIFCSDNGPTPIGSAGRYSGFKGSLWEGGHRIPAIGRWPGRIPAGSISTETVMSMDIFPTVAALGGGITPPDLKLDGVSLLPLLMENRKLPERALFWRFRNQKAMREGNWKLFLQDAAEKEPAIEGLFNLENDHGEKVNLAPADRERFEAMRSKFMAWEAEVTRGVERKT